MNATLALLINTDKTRAVVIWFDGTRHHAPVLLAKAANTDVKTLSDLAARTGICVVENSRVSESLYESVETTSVIPEEFYADIAEILAFVVKSECTKGEISEVLLSELSEGYRKSLD